MSAQGKFSRGPWEIGGDGIVGPWHHGEPSEALDEYDDREYGEDEDMSIVRWRKTIVVNDSGVYPPREADAHLIAAAPDLYAALSLILRTHDASCEGEDCGISGIDLARAAIAKAEGKQ